jgi:hypothetical protein
VESRVKGVFSVIKSKRDAVAVDNHETIVLFKVIAKFAEIVKIVDYRLELCEEAMQTVLSGSPRIAGGKGL